MFDSERLSEFDSVRWRKAVFHNDTDDDVIVEIDIDYLTNSNKRFIHVVESVDPPPCDNCKFLNQCKTKQLACDLFINYVGDMKKAGRPKKVSSVLEPRIQMPSREKYHEVFPTNHMVTE